MKNLNQKQREELRDLKYRLNVINGLVNTSGVCHSDTESILDAIRLISEGPQIELVQDLRWDGKRFVKGSGVAVKAKGRVKP